MKTKTFAEMMGELAETGLYVVSIIGILFGIMLIYKLITIGIDNYRDRRR